MVPTVKQIQPSKYLPPNDAETELCAEVNARLARLFFKDSGIHKEYRLDEVFHYLIFNEDECRRMAYLFEQAADRLAGRVLSQSDDGYVVANDRARKG